MAFIVCLLDRTGGRVRMWKVSWNYISVAVSLSFKTCCVSWSILFCWVQIRPFGNEQGNSAFFNRKSLRGLKSYLSVPPTLSANAFFYLFFCRVGDVFNKKTQKKCITRLGSQEEYLATIANGIQHTGLRLIKRLIFIWYFPSWELQKLFLFSTSASKRNQLS